METHILLLLIPGPGSMAGRLILQDGWGAMVYTPVAYRSVRPHTSRRGSADRGLPTARDQRTRNGDTPACFAAQDHAGGTSSH